MWEDGVRDRGTGRDTSCIWKDRQIDRDIAMASNTYSHQTFTPQVLQHFCPWLTDQIIWGNSCSQRQGVHLSLRVSLDAL